MSQTSLIRLRAVWSVAPATQLDRSMDSVEGVALPEIPQPHRGERCQTVKHKEPILKHPKGVV